MQIKTAMACCVWMAVAGVSAAQSAKSTTIVRLDNTKITTTEADTFAKQTLAAAHVTGTQIAVVQNGKLIWSGAYGLRGRNPDLPMDRNTTTWAASITKGVFATYVMQLVQRGQFRLDVPVARQLAKPLDQYEPYKEKASELAKDPAWLTITPRMLLSHSSGLLNFAQIEPDKKMHLHFKPGSQFLYSGEGINLVQFLVEEQQKQPLDILMRDAIFVPNGMTHTAIIWNSQFENDVADRFDAAENFHAKTRRFPARAAGSMTTSAEDLARFAEALFAGKLLDESARKEMLTPVLSIRSLHQFALAANEPEGKEAADVGLSYGIGWGLLTNTKFGPAFFKEGHGDGAQNYMICFEKSQSCMIVLTNSDNGEFAFRALFEKILGDTVTPWEWEGYTPSFIEENRKRGG